jgi:hypothetical protein
MVYAYFIDPENRKIEKFYLPEGRWSKKKFFLKKLGTENFRYRSGLPGLDFMYVDPEQILAVTAYAFIFRNDLPVFGKAVIIGCDTETEGIANPELRFEDLTENIQFLTKEETDAVPNEIRVKIMEDLIFHRKTNPLKD